MQTCPSETTHNLDVREVVQEYGIWSLLLSNQSAQLQYFPLIQLIY